MRMGLLGSVAIALTVCLGGCSETFRGLDPIVTAQGTFATDPNTAGLTRLFFKSAGASYSSPGDSTLAKQMISDGFALIYSGCNDYFRDAGRTQQRLLFARDLLGSLGTLATGVIAVAHASKDATAIAALITSTGYSVADNVAKDFLFSADNIESVRDLTLRALQADQANVLPDDTEKTFSYQTATMYLEANQNYCTLRKIAALVKESITNAPLDNGPAGSPTKLTGSTGTAAPAPPPPPANPMMLQPMPSPAPVVLPRQAPATFRHVPIRVKPLAE